MENTRDPKRIHKITALIHSYWAKYPDLRFFQVISNIEFEYNQSVGDTKIPDIFFLEDEEFEKFLINLINQ